MRELFGWRSIGGTLFMLLTIVSPARAGTITGLTISPTEAIAGTTVSATATGNGLCGAVHINWGDGPGITYATSTLPVTQTHVYQAPGAYVVRAQGMGNCDGEATARVTIKALPAPSTSPPPPRLTAIEMAPTPASPRTPVAITLQGNGPCRLMLDFGDGNNQEVSGDLPLAVRHTYAVAGIYTLTATPAAPCSSRQSAKLQVAAPDVPTIAGVSVEEIPGAARGRRSIEVTGTGRCTYTLDYGDGNTESRTGTLPDVAQHNYPADGRYTIVATAQAPCVGIQRSTIVVGRSRDVPGAITGMTIAPQVARTGEAITITIAGSGPCRLTIDLDDGESRTVTELLPYRFTYRYAAPGEYSIVAWTSDPCSGEADALVRVRRR